MRSIHGIHLVNDFSDDSSLMIVHKSVEIIPNCINMLCWVGLRRYCPRFS